MKPDSRGMRKQEEAVPSASSESERFLLPIAFDHSLVHMYHVCPYAGSVLFVSHTKQHRLVLEIAPRKSPGVTIFKQQHFERTT